MEETAPAQEMSKSQIGIIIGIVVAAVVAVAELVFGIDVPVVPLGA